MPHPVPTFFTIFVTLSSYLEVRNFLESVVGFWWMMGTAITPEANGHINTTGPISADLCRK